MGAIDSMRSVALAGRALEDVQNKTIDGVRQVNSALGSTLGQAIDSLQQLMDARVAQATSTLQKMRSSLGGEGGVTDNMIKTAVMMIPSAGGGIAAWVAYGVKIIGAVVSLGATIQGCAIDYKNYAASWGVSDDPVEIDGEAFPQTTGASRLVDLRDAMMPRYQVNRGNGGAEAWGNTNANQGSMGTWRPM